LVYDSASVCVSDKMARSFPPPKVGSEPEWWTTAHSGFSVALALNGGRPAELLRVKMKACGSDFQSEDVSAHRQTHRLAHTYHLQTLMSTA
jgi:hypothetical protein